MTADRQAEDDVVVERLRGLARDIAPAAALETRIAERLMADGLLRTAIPGSNAVARAPWKALAMAAGVVLAFVTGWVAGSHRDLGAPAQSRYVLLLYGLEAQAPARDNVQIYRDWARDLRATGRQVSGERLAPRRVSPDDLASDDGLQGYFVIEAASDREALAIAATHPHTRSGGRIVVRRIEPT